MVWSIVSSMYCVAPGSVQRDIGMLALGALAMVAYNSFTASNRIGWTESTLEMGKRLLNRVPGIKERQQKEIEEKYAEFSRDWTEKYADFGEMHSEIPAEGLSEEDLRALLHRYANKTNAALQGRHFSGTIYSSADLPTEQAESLPSVNADNTDNVLQRLFMEAYRFANLWNPLHGDKGEFAIGSYISKQVVRMVASMFGGNPDEVMGFVTNGGTESLMTAARAYRNWGKRTKGLGAGECVIIAPDTIHAALLKAAEDYEIKVVLAPTDASGKVKMEELESLVEKHKNQLVALFASAPSYGTGVVDDIDSIAALADQYGCGMHVDCCLGGYIVNYLDENKNRFLAIPGVTSSSCDTHKNGKAPKGSSTVIFKKLGIYNLAFYAVYSFPNWECFYATPTTAGSQSSVGALTALLAMLGTGKAGYREIALNINRTAKELAQRIKDDFDGNLEVIAEPEVNVLAIRTSKEKEWVKIPGAIYELAKQMKKRGFVLTTLKKQRAHFCLTNRFVTDPDAKENFLTALHESLNKVIEKVKAGKKLPGEAVLYGTLQEVYEPELGKMSLTKYIEYLFFGQDVARDVVKQYVLASL